MAHSRQATSVHCMQEWANQDHHGLKISGRRKALQVHLIDHRGIRANIGRITSMLANNSRVHVLLGPYTSFSERTSRVAAEAGALLISGSSAARSIFAERPYSFGLLPPSDERFVGSLAMLQHAGATSVARVFREGSDAREVRRAAVLKRMPGLRDLGVLTMYKNATREDIAGDWCSSQMIWNVTWPKSSQCLADPHFYLMLQMGLIPLTVPSFH